MKDSTSVLMAKAAALALATTVYQQLQLININFLSDSQGLVQFLNGFDISNPPNWRIKPFTQIIRNYTQGRSTSILNISRNQNQIADLLARQALSDLDSNLINHSCVYSNPTHVDQCPLPLALQLITINSVMVLTARCC